MDINGLGFSGITPRLPADVGTVGAPAGPSPLGVPADGGVGPAFGFSDDSSFEAVGGPGPALSRQAPMEPEPRATVVQGQQPASALTALSGQSDFDATSSIAAAAPAGARASERTQAFLREALSQDGNRYVFGAEARADEANPKALDCSELVEWAAARAGVRVPDGSANQIDAVRPMSVEQALQTPGALLYRPGHIAISLGDGRTIEARNRKAGVGVFGAHDRGWTRAGTIRGLE